MAELLVDINGIFTFHGIINDPSFDISKLRREAGSYSIQCARDGNEEIFTCQIINIPGGYTHEGLQLKVNADGLYARKGYSAPDFAWNAWVHITAL